MTLEATCHVTFSQSRSVTWHTILTLLMVEACVSWHQIDMSLIYSFWTTIFALKIQVSHINRIELTASFSKLQLNNYLQTILNYNEVINCTLFLFSNKHLRIKITHWLFKSPKHATYVFVHFYLRHTPLNGETKITSFKSTRYFSCHFEKKLLSTSHQHFPGLEISNP